MKELAPSAIPAALIKGTGVSLLITMFGAAIMSWLIIRDTLKETAIGYCAMAILMAASFVGPAWAIRKAGEKRMQIALLVAAIYAAVLLILNWILYKGGYEGVGETLLIIAGGSVTASLTISGSGNGSRGRRRKKKHR